MLKKAENKERLKEIKALYETSFPKSEKKPFAYMVKKQKEGFFDILAIEGEDGSFRGLAVMMLSGGLALLDYLAIDPRYQGLGMGSAVLAELREKYGRENIVVEIESTLSASLAGTDAEEMKKRLRRKAFYLRNGMMPTGYLVDLFGVEMEVLTFGRELPYEAYYGIYAGILPARLLKKIKPAGKAGGGIPR